MVAHRGPGWVLAPTLVLLEAEADRLAPGRSRVSDGSIGDAAHSARYSDHNPDGDADGVPTSVAVVDALDLTHDPAGGFDAHGHADDIARRGDSRVSYLISNGRIWNPSRDAPGEWRPYSGSNPHTKHMHVSVTDAGRRDLRVWLNGGHVATPADPVTCWMEAEMFIAVNGYGFFVVVDGVPQSFPSMAAFGAARSNSTNVPTLWLERAQGEPLIQNLLKKHAAAVAA